LNTVKVYSKIHWEEWKRSDKTGSHWIQWVAKTGSRWIQGVAKTGSRWIQGVAKTGSRWIQGVVKTGLTVLVCLAALLQWSQFFYLYDGWLYVYCTKCKQIYSIIWHVYIPITDLTEHFESCPVCK